MANLLSWLSSEWSFVSVIRSLSTKFLTGFFTYFYFQLQFLQLHQLMATFSEPLTKNNHLSSNWTELWPPCCRPTCTSPFRAAALAPSAPAWPQWRWGSGRRLRRCRSCRCISLRRWAGRPRRSWVAPGALATHTHSTHTNCATRTNSGFILLWCWCSVRSVNSGSMWYSVWHTKCNVNTKPWD